MAGVSRRGGGKPQGGTGCCRVATSARMEVRLLEWTVIDGYGGGKIRIPREEEEIG